MSGDGRVIVGNPPPGSDSLTTLRGFEWVPESGQMQEIDPPPEAAISRANATNYDGSVVFGYTSSPDVAFRWSADEGLEAISALDSVEDVSRDGRVLLGTIAGRPVLLVEGEIQPLPVEGEYVEAYGLSGDGTTVVGYIARDSGPPQKDEAFSWTSSGGLRLLAGPTNVTHAKCSSHDGAVVFGFFGADADEGRDVQAFRWSRGGGYEEIGPFFPSASSANGNRLVGSRYDETGNPKAVIWDRLRGMRDLDQELDAWGIDRQGAILEEAAALSDDGRFVAGTANVLGEQRPFRATLR